VTLSKSPHLDSVVIQSGRYAALRGRIIEGTLSYENEVLTENQIRKGLVSLIKSIEEWAVTDSKVKREIAEVKIGRDATNTAINSPISTGGGNVQFGHNTYIEYAGEKVPHFLTESPQVLPVFKGRDEELTKLHDQLFDGEGDHLILLVNGQGGVGKTSIATQYFFNYNHEYSHAAWVLKEGSIQDAMLKLEFGLNLKFSKETDKQRLSIILQKVANLKAPCLLIIDNANERDDLKQHISTLRQCANFHVLLTSRLDSFDGAKTYKVGPLPEPIAKGLFEQYYRAFNEEEAAIFPDVYKAVDGNTLVLQLLAKNLIRNRRKYHLPDLLTDLQERGVLRLSQTKKVVTNYGTLSEGQIEDIVAAMYDLGDLSVDQLKLLSVFAALPPEKILFDHLEVLVTFLDDLEETLNELQELGWVEESEDAYESSYRCSPVVQAVVRNKNGEWRKILPFLRSEIKDLLASDQSGNLKIGIKAARPFVTYGEAIAPFLPRVEPNLFFYQQLMFYYNSSGDLSMSMTWGLKIASLAKGLLKDDPDNSDLKNGLAISYEKLGETHSDLGQLPKALQFFEIETKLFEELHRDFPDNVGFKNGLAISYEKLGETHSDLGQLPKALQFFEIETKLFEELHRDFPDNVGFKNGLAISYSKLGQTHSDLGQLPKALQFFEERSRLGQELHRDFPDNVGFKNGLAISYSKLGQTHSDLGQLPKALQFFEERSRLGQELHRDFPDNVGFKNGLAISYEKLGQTHSDLGQLPKALQFFDLDIELSKELHRDFPDNVGFKNGLAISYEKLGQTHSDLGQLPKALQFFEIETKLFEELHRDFPDNVGFKNGLAISYEKLGKTHSDLGQLPKALQFFEIETKLFEELHRDFPDNVGFKNGLAISYEKLGKTHSDLGQLPKALQFFEIETKLFEELHRDFPDNVGFKNGLAISYEKLGKTHSAMGQLPKALQFFEERSRLGQELHRDFPDNVGFKNGLAISYSKLGQTHSDLGQLPKALQFFDLDIELSKELHRDFPDNVGFKNGLAISYVKLGEVAQAAAEKQAHYRKAEQLWIELTDAFPGYAQFHQFLEAIRKRLAKF
jgi:tetratricopeptide (TPR) repeat protein